MHLSIRFLLVFCLLFVLGCTQSTTLEFASGKDFEELPEKHQKNVREGLSKLFGTPINPRMRSVDPDAEASPEGESVALADTVSRDHLKHGAAVYTARCAGCHGVTGDGNGPAGKHLRPRPRDYRQGVFKFTSTPYGSKPARHDLVRTIRRGAKGTSMPAFPWMSDADLNAVIDYVVFLSRRGEVEGEAIYMSQEFAENENIEFEVFTDAVGSSVENWADAEGEIVLPVTAEPEYNEESVVAGRTLYLSQGCSKCHGVDGKGQVEWLSPEFHAEQAKLPEDQRVQINYDAWEEPAPAADLTARLLHGGRRPIDIYRRIYTGINGTPMPAFGDLFAENPDNIWHLVHYVLHIIEGGDPTAGVDTTEISEATDQEESGDVAAEDVAPETTVTEKETDE